MATPKTPKPNEPTHTSSDRHYGTCPVTGKSYHNLTTAQRTQIANVKTLLMRWLGNNAEWKDTESLAAGKRAFATIGDLIRAEKFPVVMPTVEDTSPEYKDKNPPRSEGKV